MCVYVGGEGGGVEVSLSLFHYLISHPSSRISCRSIFQAIMHMENMSSSIVTPLSSLWNVRDKLLTPNVILLFHAQLGWQRVPVLSGVGVDQVSVSLLFLSLNTMIVSLSPTLLFFIFFIIQSTIRTFQDRQTVQVGYPPQLGTPTHKF